MPYMSAAALYCGGGSIGMLDPTPIPCSRMAASSLSFLWCASSLFWYPAISSRRVDDAVKRDACVSPRTSRGAWDDADAASLCNESCVHADGAADSLRDTCDEADASPSPGDIAYVQVVGEADEMGDVGEARRRSRGGGCGGVSPSYGFGRSLPSSVLGSALCVLCVSRRPGLSE